MKNLGYLITAYFIFWLFTSVYLFSIDRRMDEVRRALDRLSKDQKSR